MSVEPIALHVVRHRCPFCPKSYASKSRTVAHIARCWMNPAARACKTCVHYYPGDNGCFGDPACNCASGEFCRQKVVFPLDSKGIPTLAVGCPAWEPDQEDGVTS